MKGYVSVNIPVKKYVKAYLIHKFGKDIVMNFGSNNIANKLYDILEHKTNEWKKDYNETPYCDVVKVYIPKSVFNHRGANLNETNIKSFNKFVELEVKDKFYFMMDFFCKILPSYEAHIDLVRRELGIDEDVWSYDSMKKDYYRYRKKKNLPKFYKKFADFVPSEKSSDKGF